MSNSDEQKRLQILLSLGIDKTSLEKGISEFKKIQGAVQELEKEAENLRQKIKAALQAKDAKELEIELEKTTQTITELKKQASAALSAGFVSAADAAKRMNEELRETQHYAQQAAYNLRDVGEKLNQIGGMASNVGNGILNPIMGMVNTYLQTAPIYDESAARWNAAQKEMQASFARIGGVAVDKLLPLVESTSDLVKQIADLLEKHPGIVALALGVGGGLKAGGMVLQGIGQYQMMQGTLQHLTGNTLQGLAGNAIAKYIGSAATVSSTSMAARLAMAGAGQTGATASQFVLAPGLAKAAAAGGSALSAVPGAATLGGGALGGAGALGVYGLALGLGGLAGKELGNGINRLTGQDEQSWGDILTTVKQISALASPLNGVAQGLKAAGFEEQGNAVWEFVKAMNGLGDAAQDAEKKTSKSALAAFAKANVQDFIAFEKQKAEAATQYAEQVKQVEADAAKQRLQIIENFAAASAKAEQSYATANAQAARSFASANSQAAAQVKSQLGKLAADYAAQEKQAESDYYQSRSEAARSYSQEVQRAEQDHQREMLKLQADHQQRVSDLVDARDALGLAREQRSYEKQRAEAEGSYSLEAQRKNQDYARQMADLEASFAQARAQRLTDYRRQVAETENSYREARAQRAREFAAQQQERAQQHNLEMARLKKEQEDQLKLLNQSSGEQLAKLREAYQKQSQMMQSAFIDRLNAMSKSILGDTKAYEKWMTDNATRFQTELNKLGFKLGIPGKASGGPVFADRTYLVGEQGPELFTAPRDGSIVPAGLTAALLRGGSASVNAQKSLTINIPVSGASRADAAYLQRVVRGAVESALLNATGVAL